MDILLIEPYFTGSHAQWAEGFAKNSRHNVELLTMPGRYWKWRMHGGAVTLAGRFTAENMRPDLIVVSDMLDLTTFLALTREVTADIPVAIYFHENQLTYPWQPGDRDVEKGRDAHYGFINFSSALCADKVFFNSKYHQESFLTALDDYLKAMPEYNEPASVERIRRKSGVLYPGMELSGLDVLSGVAKHTLSSPDSVAGGEGLLPLILWNHRWEYDKNPEVFFKALYLMQEKGLGFEVAILGENFSRSPVIFDEARDRLGPRIRRYGFIKDRSEYARWLARADILPVTSTHDFFGCSVVEAIYMDTLPLLPKRLAYPEHIPEGLREKYLYNDHEGLCSRLEAAIRGVGEIRAKALLVGGEPAELKAYVARYDWSRMTPVYDNELERVVVEMRSMNRV